jgi:hypothetical protein
MKELLTKQAGGEYTLNEFGRAGVQLLQRVEEPIAESSRKVDRLLIRPLQALGVLVIVALTASSLSQYYSNRDMSAQISQQQSEIEQMQAYLQAYSSLFDSNFTTPVSKGEAVAKALSSGGWNSTSLMGKEITANLCYVKFWYSDKGSGQGFQMLDKVTAPVNDYSPRAEYNVTLTDVFPPVKATVWYRYVWTVSVHSVRREGGFSIIVRGDFYYVDASTGEIIPHGILF